MTQSNGQMRDRIKELRRVPARELLPNPKNWRTHGEMQSDALRAVLTEIGYADALLVRETPDGLMLIDGHLRAETTPDQDVPVLVVDVTEEEADKLLATHDPLATMAGTDAEALERLLDTVTTEDVALGQVLAQLAGNAPDFASLSLPTADEIATREAALAQQMAEHAKGRSAAQLELTCPECGADFEIRAKDLLGDAGDYKPDGNVGND